MTKISLFITFLVCLPIVALLFSFDPIAQDINYHQFADDRYMLSVPNNLNVISNIPLLLVGLYGLWGVLISESIKIQNKLKPGLIIFFAGVTLVSVGSGYYHITPNNQSMIWDRLPMAIAFMALFSITYGEFISSRYVKTILISLLSFGIFSIVYWSMTEARGVGDLRPYILVQFLPMILIPIFLVMNNRSSRNTSGYWLLIGFYVLAKVFEYYDYQIFMVISAVSGHSLKHIAAAVGVFLLVRSYKDKKLT